MKHRSIGNQTLLVLVFIARFVKIVLFITKACGHFDYDF